LCWRTIFLAEGIWKVHIFRHLFVWFQTSVYTMGEFHKNRNNSTVFEELSVPIVDLTVANIRLYTRSQITSDLYILNWKSSRCLCARRSTIFPGILIFVIFRPRDIQEYIFMIPMPNALVCKQYGWPRYFRLNDADDLFWR
jgi:hypothetical protein